MAIPYQPWAVEAEVQGWGGAGAGWRVPGWVAWAPGLMLLCCHHKPYEMLLGVLRREGRGQVPVPPQGCPLVSRWGSFASAAAHINPREKLPEAEEGCEKWRESGGDAKAKAVAGTSPSPTCPPRGEQANFTALSVWLLHTGWTGRAVGLLCPGSRVGMVPLGCGGAPGPPPQTAPNLYILLCWWPSSCITRASPSAPRLGQNPVIIVFIFPSSVLEHSWMKDII